MTIWCLVLVTEYEVHSCRDGKEKEFFFFKIKIKTILITSSILTFYFGLQSRLIIVHRSRGGTEIPRSYKARSIISLICTKTTSLGTKKYRSSLPYAIRMKYHLAPPSRRLRVGLMPFPGGPVLRTVGLEEIILVSVSFLFFIFIFVFWILFLVGSGGWICRIKDGT